ncbi:zinc finger protein 1035 isoform X3 [Thalassophryne amazonica]|uniref:zinc finger protein 1035 isoform X3 n=1 Tax=Thalassophryne amazonica TaxID=390379 RepID=UPI0014718A85|nr:zinc finger protein 1035 isoform X3 [Thalassophryne amazonica]XP_034030997.1 zinc finger protein 1035 isoform X3 [Thalassophryne amazonica]
MMLGLQGNASSPKVYRCVACSATFNGLASLLVHQASHASSLPKVPVPSPTQSSVGMHDAPCASNDSSSEHRSPPALDGSSPSFFICDCGEEFQEFDLMLEHKNSHDSSVQMLQPVDSNGSHSSREECDKVPPTPYVSSLRTNQQDVVISDTSTSRSPAAELLALPDHKVDESLEEGIAIATTPQGQCTSPHDPTDKPSENTATSIDMLPQSAEDSSLQDKTPSVLSNNQGEHLPKNNALMKMLASAYTKHLPHLQSQNQNSMIIPKQEAVPVHITPRMNAPQLSPVNDLSIAQLRRLLARPGIKTKAPPIGKVLEFSKKKIVSLTKTLSPVVLLETRQKLMDPNSKGVHGTYQCGRCRRVFQDLDRLTEHHFLHKKERIKCCRRCKQLIIGKPPFPNDHVCPHLVGRTSFVQKMQPIPSVNNAKKVFYCPLCKHSYARRYNLKMHKCQGPRSFLSHHYSPSIETSFVLRSNSKASVDEEDTDGALPAKSIGVSTDIAGHIKVEAPSPKSEQSASSQIAWSSSAKHFPPFSPNMDEQEDVSPRSTSPLQADKNSSWDTAAVENEDGDGGQWTMPLDDEMDVFSNAGGLDDDDKNAMMAQSGFHFFVSDGVKRYPCNRCQKTYSRPDTLSRHLRLCGFRPRGLGPITQSSSMIASPVNTKQIYACYVCGKTFNRKDNMMVHRKKCQLKRTMVDVNSGPVQQNMSSSLTDGKTEDDDGGNWGIMSLPPVLPRRVTCECGVGFTCPRLLLGHLQKHAQESYTCPTCGKTINSWADYEVHLQSHMRPHHQLLKGIQSQRSQPVLLRLQQPSPGNQPPPSGHSLPQPAHLPPQKQPRTIMLPNPAKKQQRIACTRCGNTFSGHASLRKHITWNRCKGEQSTTPPKTHHCSNCNSDFPNTISLIFHQRSGACNATKHVSKPVRCPTCLRWYGSVSSLQKHLLTHKRSESYRCDICQGVYSNLKSLKVHRRRIHRIMAGGTLSNTEEQLITSG